MVATVGDYMDYLRELGFEAQKRKHGGSHIWRFVHPDGRSVCMAAGRRSKELTIGVLKALCDQAEIDWRAAKEAIWD